MFTGYHQLRPALTTTRCLNQEPTTSQESTIEQHPADSCAPLVNELVDEESHPGQVTIAAPPNNEFAKVGNSQKSTLTKNITWPTHKTHKRQPQKRLTHQTVGNPC